jgi:hypothetical protein
MSANIVLFALFGSSISTTTLCVGPFWKLKDLHEQKRCALAFLETAHDGGLQNNTNERRTKLRIVADRRGGPGAHVVSARCPPRGAAAPRVLRRGWLRGALASGKRRFWLFCAALPLAPIGGGALCRHAPYGVADPAPSSQHFKSMIPFRWSNM